MASVAKFGWVLGPVTDPREAARPRQGFVTCGTDLTSREAPQPTYHGHMIDTPSPPGLQLQALLHEPFHVPITQA